MALKNNGANEVTWMSTGLLGKFNEHLEGCELGLKYTLDSKSDTKLNFHYIKDFIDYRVAVEMSKDGDSWNPKWTDKWVTRLDMFHNALIFGSTGKGTFKNFFAERNAVLFCNVPGTSSTVGAVATTETSVKDGKKSFGLTGLGGFWRNQTESGLFGHDAVCTPEGGVVSKMGAALNFDDHTWFMRFDTTGACALALQW